MTSTDTIRRLLVRVTKPQILFPLIAALLIAAICGTTFGLIRLKDSADEHAAAVSTRELLGIYEAQVVRALHEIDQTLNLVKFWPQRNLHHTLKDLNDRGLLPPDLLFVISITDRDGTIVDSTRPDETRSVADKDYFQKQRAGDEFVASHLPQGPTGDAKLLFSRRLNASNGAFDGIVIVGVDAAYFVSGYDPSKLGGQAVLSMIGDDGISRVRRTGDVIVSGEAIDVGAAMGDPEVETDARTAISSWDGVRRWTSARKLYGFPLAVLVGLSVDEQMASASRQARAYVGWAALAGILVAGLTALLGRMSWQVERSREMFRLMAESTKAIPFTLDLTRGCFTYIGAQAIAASDVPESQWEQPGALEIVFPREANRGLRQCFDETKSGHFDFVTALPQRNSRSAEVRWTGTCEMAMGAKYLRGLMLDITELRRLGRELAASQKLESVGRLAAGVAHEINTPVQFVSDNVQFVHASLREVGLVIRAYRELQYAVQSSSGVVAAARNAHEAETAADLDYIMENVPLAIDSSLEGLGRIATIVRSMKEFAHPDQQQKSLADLNQAIRSTLVIAQNEYKHVATIDTQFGDLPPIPCYLGEMNQVFLNLLLNASSAIAEAVKGTANLGKLTVRTRLDRNEVEVSIADTGTGIPEGARDKVFDPFFTTKEVGKGSGQGLAIAHNVVVHKHGGTLRFESECGVGTTFIIRLPVHVGGDADQVVENAA